jgi:coenzyme F420 hydrogenase subunit beta
LIFSHQQIKTLKDIVDRRLCAGCGACYYALPEGAVSMVNIESEGIRPKFFIDPTKTADCLSFCPGYSVADLRSNGTPNKIIQNIGSALQILQGHAADPEIRFHGSSGGILSSLALYCLEKEGMAFVLHTAMDKATPWANKTVISRGRNDIVQAAGSRYAPSSPCDGLRFIEESDRPCVFIGKPCDVAAVNALRKQRPRLNKNLGLVLTFFCAGTPSTQGTLDLLGKLNVQHDKIQRLKYRGEGWPGVFKAQYTGGKIAAELSYNESWSRLTYYRPLRCSLCADGLGRLGDVSCGDAWNLFQGADDPGRSLMIIRSESGANITKRAIEAGYLKVSPASLNDVLEAQKSLLKRRKWIFGRKVVLRLRNLPTPRYAGFSLFRSWLTLSFVDKGRSLFGRSSRRLIHRYKKTGN